VGTSRIQHKAIVSNRIAVSRLILFCSRCGSRMQRESPADRIEECVNCGRRALPVRVDRDYPGWWEDERSAMRSCMQCKVDMFANDTYCRECGFKNRKLLQIQL
jgi:hypothetical protein